MARTAKGLSPREPISVSPLMMASFSEKRTSPGRGRRDKALAQPQTCRAAKAASVPEDKHGKAGRNRARADDEDRR